MMIPEVNTTASLLLGALSTFSNGMMTPNIPESVLSEVDSMLSNIDPTAPCNVLNGQLDIKYLVDMPALGRSGYEGFFNIYDIGPSSGFVPAPGLCSTSLSRYDDIKKFLEDLPEALGDDTYVRENALGLFRLSDKLFLDDIWSDGYAGLFLGAPRDDHDFIRPIVDYLYGGGSIDGDSYTASFGGAFSTSGRHWSQSDLIDSAQTFFASKDESLLVGVDEHIWVTKQLHKISLGIILSDQQAQIFFGLQSALLGLSILPDALAETIAPEGAFAQAEQGLAYFRNLYNDTIANSTDSRLVHVRSLLVDEGLYSQVVNALLEANLLAGGLSVPSIIKSSTAYYHAGFLDDTTPEFDTTSLQKIKLLALESTRLNPPVLGVPVINPVDGERISGLAGMAGFDKDTYGPTAGDFKIRGDISYYHNRSLNWADVSVHPSDPTKHRVCPGRSLSLSMASAYLFAMKLDDWYVESGVSSLNKVNGPSWWDDFNLSKIVDCPTASEGSSGDRLRKMKSEKSAKCKSNKSEKRRRMRSTRKRGV